MHLCWQGGHCSTPLLSLLGMVFKVWGSLPRPQTLRAGRSYPPRKDLTSGKNPTSSGSQGGESGGASSPGIPFLVKYKVWCSEPRQIVCGGSDAGSEVNSKAAAGTASLEETYSPGRALYPQAVWAVRYKKALSFLQLHLINTRFLKMP